MKLEEQVVSLELAKKLKELGAKQESLFWWEKWSEFGDDEFCLIDSKRRKDLSDEPHDTFRLPVAELGEMLKEENLPQWQGDFRRWIAFFNNRRIVEEPTTEADARAKMLVYLVENKLIDLEKTLT